MSETLQEFHDALMAETSNALRLMSEANRATARAIEAQAHLMDHLLDGIRRFSKVGINSTITLKQPEGGLSQWAIDEIRRMSRDTVQEHLRPGPPIHQQPQTIISGEEGSTVHRTREGREVKPVSPLDEVDYSGLNRELTQRAMGFLDQPGTFAEVSPDVLAREGVVIVEKVLEPVPEDTILDGSGRLVPAPPEMKPDFAAIERMRLEDEERQRRLDQIVETFHPDLNPSAAPADKVHDLESAEMQALQQESISEFEEDEIAHAAHKVALANRGLEQALAKPDTPAQAVHKAQKAVEHAPAMPREEEIKPGPGITKAETAQDRILNHYAEHGLGYEETAQLFELSPSTIASYISTGRGRQDPRAAQGDIKRLAREDDETTALRNVLIADAKSRNGEIVFPDDDMIGVAAYRVNYSEGVIEAPEGNLPLSKAWLRIMDLLKDRDEHPTDDVWNAGRFPNERSVLKNLKTINEALAQVKLFIVAEAKTYQLASLR